MSAKYLQTTFGDFFCMMTAKATACCKSLSDCVIVQSVFLSADNDGLLHLQSVAGHDDNDSSRTSRLGVISDVLEHAMARERRDHLPVMLTVPGECLCLPSLRLEALLPAFYMRNQI